MSKIFATLIDECEAELQDSNNTIWTAAELAIQLEKAIKEVSDYVPYIMLEVFKIESRTGSATSTTANKLVDSQGQFLSTDVNKVIYNTTDKTWAVVTAYVDANTLTLSKDIMISGEAYEMFNRNCRSNKELYIGDITDSIGVDHGILQDDEHATEYPLGTKRNVEVSGDILTIKVDSVSDSAENDADVEAFIWFKKRHRVSQLTDLDGTINGTPAAGAKTMAVAGFTGTEIIAEDTLFTIASMRGTYRTTQATTLAAGAGTIYFYPGLDKAGTDTAVIRVIGSTLDKRLETLVVQIATGKAIMSKALLNARQVPKGGAGQVPSEMQLGNIQYSLAIRELEKGRKVQIKQTYSRV